MKGGGVEKGEKQVVGRNTGYNIWMNKSKRDKRKPSKKTPLFRTRARELILKLLTLYNEVH